MSTPFRLLERLYADTVARDIWSETATVECWLAVEGELARAQAAEGLIGESDALRILQACQAGIPDTETLWAEARNVGYPILGLVRALAATLPAGPDGRVHYGATTQDIMDTALAMQCQKSARHLIDRIQSIGDHLAAGVERYSELIIAGRTHGQQAVPTTFGTKLAVYLQQFADARDRIATTGHAVARVSLFGAGGTNAAMGPKGRAVRHRLAEALALDVADVPWHVCRERLVDFAHACAVVASICLRFAREVVDLSRTEIGEITERRAHHRGASSTMPQKANPVAAESIIGFAISANAAATGLMRSIEAEHERSAGEWQSEWLLLPQVIEHTASALTLTLELVSTMEVHGDAMARNLEADGGLLMSEATMMRLAETLGREHAHAVVYAAAQKSRATHTPFLDALGETIWQTAAPLDAAVEPRDYLGESASVRGAAIARWRQHRDAAENALCGHPTRGEPVEFP